MESRTGHHRRGGLGVLNQYNNSCCMESGTGHHRRGGLGVLNQCNNSYCMESRTGHHRRGGGWDGQRFKTSNVWTDYRDGAQSGEIYKNMYCTGEQNGSSQ